MVLLYRILHVFVIHQALVIGISLAGFALLLTALLLVGDMLLEALGRTRTLLLLILPILAMPCLLAVAIFGIFFAGSINRVFAAANGVPAANGLAQIIPAAGTIHPVQNRILIRYAGNSTLASARFDNAVFYRQPEDLTLPHVNAPFAIRTLLGNESNLVTNDPCDTFRKRVFRSSFESFEARLQLSSAYQTHLDDYAVRCPILIATSPHP